MKALHIIPQFLCLGWAAILPAHAQTVTGNGTKEAPFRTIEQALTVARAGDTIHITAGNYLPAGNTFDFDRSVTLRGGYDEAFSRQTPGTTFFSKRQGGTAAYDNLESALLTAADNPYGLLRITGGQVQVAVEHVKVQRGGVQSGIADGAAEEAVAFYDHQLRVATSRPFGYTLYDSAGRCIRQADHLPPAVPVAFTDLTPGLYLVRVTAGAERHSLKILIH